MSVGGTFCHQVRLEVWRMVRRGVAADAWGKAETGGSRRDRDEGVEDWIVGYGHGVLALFRYGGEA